MKVLVIEDSPSFSEVLRQTLVEHGHVVALVSTLEAAFLYLTQNIVEAIVVDLKLSDSTIEQTVERIPSLRACCARLVVVTGHSVDADELMNAGAAAVLAKSGGSGFFRDLVMALNGDGHLWEDPKTPT